MNSDIITAAKILRDYHQLGHSLTEADCIVVFGSSDTRPAKRGAELWSAGYAPYLLFSGGAGRITKDKQEQSEAETYKEFAVGMGVPEEKILLEDRSTNSSENVLFAVKLLEKKSINHNSLILVHKPYMERRGYATFKNYYPEVELTVTSPKVSFSDYPDEQLGIDEDHLINMLVGDTQRIELYAEKGFMIKQQIPQEVRDAMKLLIAAGYTKQLIEQ